MFCNDFLCGFTSVLHFPHPSSDKIKRGHRTVILPDFQGIGLGVYLRDFVANLYTSQGFQFITTTSNPALIHSMNKSKKWKLTAKGRTHFKPNKNNMEGFKKTAAGANRITTSWKFIW
jgi:GNAT superfamily N-acetyltransferase